MNIVVNVLRPNKKEEIRRFIRDGNASLARVRRVCHCGVIATDYTMDDINHDPEAQARIRHVIKEKYVPKFGVGGYFINVSKKRVKSFGIMEMRRTQAPTQENERFMLHRLEELGKRDMRSLKKTG